MQHTRRSSALPETPEPAPPNETEGWAPGLSTVERVLFPCGHRSMCGSAFAEPVITWSVVSSQKQTAFCKAPTKPPKGLTHVNRFRPHSLTCQRSCSTSFCPPYTRLPGHFLRSLDNLLHFGPSTNGFSVACNHPRSKKKCSVFLRFWDDTPSWVGRVTCLGAPIAQRHTHCD